jgi:hypothetical protein
MTIPREVVLREVVAIPEVALAAAVDQGSGPALLVAASTVARKVVHP